MNVLVHFLKARRSGEPWYGTSSEIDYVELHENMGHLDADCVTDLARDCFCWPQMKEDIEQHVTQVCQ